MSNKYNSLSNYLNYNIVSHSNLLVNEGFMDTIKGWFTSKNGTQPSNKQVEKSKGILGIFGALRAAFTSDDDPITKAYRDAMKEEQAEYTKQHEELSAKFRDLEAAKITAKSKDKIQQSKLKHNEKIAAVQARMEQVRAWGDRAKNAKIIRTKNDTDALLQTLDELGKDMQLGEDNPIDTMKKLTMQILVDPNTGSVRSWEEVEEAAKTDETLKSAIEEFKSVSAKNGEVIKGSLQDAKPFKDMQTRFQTIADKERAVQAELDKTNKDFEDYEKNRKAVEAVKKARAEHDLAKEGVEKATADKNKYKNPFVEISAEDGTTTPKSTDDIKKGLELPDTINIDDFIKTETAEDETEIKSFDVDKYAAYLEEKGVPFDVIDKIKNNLPKVDNPNDLPSINNAIQEALKGKKTSDGGYEEGTTISNEDITSIAESAGEKAKTEYNALRDAETRAQETLNNTPDPTSDAALADDPNDSEEERKRKSELREAVKIYNEIPNDFEDPNTGKTYKKDEIFDTSTDSGKIYNESVKTRMDAAKTRQAELDQQRDVRKAARLNDVNSLNEKKTLKLSAADEEAIADAADVLQAGETYDKEGNIGYYKINPNRPDEKVFVKRPTDSADEDEYVKGRDAAAIMSDPELNKTDGYKVKRDADGNWVKYKPENPDETTPIEHDEALKIIASRRAADKSAGSIIKKKQDFATAIKTVINAETGEVDIEKYKKLTPSQKTHIKAVLNNPELLDKAFAGIDIGGDHTLKSIKKHFETVNGSDDESFNKALDALSDIEDEDDDTAKGRDDNEYNNSQNKDNDYEDDTNAEDDGDEGEYEGDEEIDDEENGTDAEGHALKKVDGKWYKESDLENGVPKTDAQEISADNVTKNKTKKLKNPAKIWHRKKNKRTGKTTKSYYDKEGNSISRKDFKRKMKSYQKAKARAAERVAKEQKKQQSKQNNGKKPTPIGESAIDYITFRDWLFENVDTTNNYNELKSYLINKI